jgi:DNA-binding IclR family transcriptional regulator
MAANTDPATKLADAALKLLAKTAWSDLTLGQVAKAAKVPLTDLRPLASAKPALIGLILIKLGDETAKRYRPDPESSARDRVFEAAMSWFDVSNTRKPAMRSLHDGLKRDPLSLVVARNDIVKAAAWLLTLAEADTGPAIPLRAMALAGAMGHAFGAWLDDGSDMAKTMAKLDGDLRRVF